MNTIGHSPALRRAIMRARPDFYAWTDEEQLRYRMNMPDGERFLLERALLKELCGIDSDAIDSAWRNLPAPDLDRINEALLPWDGIGEDCFYLAEFLPGAERLGFETVDDYARDDHAFQETARLSEDENYAVRPYQGNLSPSWARLFVDSRKLALDESAHTSLERRESAAVDAFLDAQYRDILQHFDPKVSRLKRRRRVLVHEDAFR